MVAVQEIVGVIAPENSVTLLLVFVLVWGSGLTIVVVLDSPSFPRSLAIGF